MRRAFFLLILLFFLLPTLAAAYCAPTKLPKVTLSLQETEVALGQTIVGTFASSAENLLGATMLEPVPGFLFAENGSFSFTPRETTANRTRILFYAVSPEGCTVTRIALFTIRYPPEIDRGEPQGNVTIPEGRPRLFSAKSEEKRLTWSLDGEIVAENISVYLYRPDFNAAGTHLLVLEATNDEGLSSRIEWNITVENQNQPPLQVTEFLSIILPMEGNFIFGLDNYFVDLDGTDLTYTITEESVDGGNLSISIDGDSATLVGKRPGKLFLTFTATDPAGASVSSRMTPYFVSEERLATREPYCGDLLCLLPEDCDSCSEDCGSCEEEVCRPKWDCTPWGECLFPGYQTRVCAIVNECNATNESQPPEARGCDYNPTCDDGVMNGNETGVDCGGSCAPCPTCDDGLLNQGEEAVDCGGPCVPCPSCSDLLQNQDESDVDCGGLCAPCSAGKMCFLLADCASRACEAGFCLASTCNDTILNQGEERVDCGGPCAACPTCFDGLQNQDESDVDCGGSCAPCPTCDDGLLNQGEERVDCGGPCRECIFNDYLPEILRWVSIVITISLVLGILYLLRAIFTSRMLFLFRHKKAIHFFYEDDLTYVLVRIWNFLMKPFRRDPETQEIVEKGIQEIIHLHLTVPEQVLRRALVAKLRGLYAAILKIPADFEFEILVHSIRGSSFSFCVKVILLRNTKILYSIEKAGFYTDVSYAISDILKALKELRKGL